MTHAVSCEDPYPHRPLPGWLFSLGVHFGLLVVLSWIVPEMQQRPTETVEPERGVEIVLRPRESSLPVRFAEEGAEGNGIQVERSSAPDEVVAAAHFDPLPKENEVPPSVVAIAAEPESIAAAVVPASAVNLVNAPPGAGKPSGQRSKPGDIQTEVFGVKATGSSFVYVFDRSASMAGQPLARAKRELLASLRDLPETSSFQIIFYNDRPEAYAAANKPPTLHPATAAELGAAGEFIDEIRAENGTEHLAALKLALRMRPDAIFFLTDGNEPELLAADFDAIQHLNRGTAIHCVEFGLGPKRTGRSFLERLAEENGGRYGYVDVTRLP